MSVVNLPIARIASDTELERVAQLAGRMSARLTRVAAEDIGPVIAEALAQVVDATLVGACRLIEFTDADVEATHPSSGWGPSRG